MSEQLSLVDAAFATRERILNAYANRPRGEYLKSIRVFARDLAHRNGTVAVDDLRAELVAHNFPLPDDLEWDERMLGAAFRSPEFVPVGQRVSRWNKRVARSGSGSAVIRIYALRAA